MSGFDAVQGAKNFLANAGSAPPKRQKTELCKFFNSEGGCRNSNCSQVHACNVLRPNGTPCGGTNHNRLSHHEKPVPFKKIAAHFKGGDKKKGNKGKGAKGGKGGKGGKGAK